jgi:hypothetical protein
VLHGHVNRVVIIEVQGEGDALLVQSLVVCGAGKGVRMKNSRRSTGSSRWMISISRTMVSGVLVGKPRI